MESYKKIDNYYFKPTSKPLGKGAFATVYQAYDEAAEGKEVAVKVIPAMKLLENQENYELFMREIEVLRQIKGENIVQLLDVKRTPNNLYIFTEFCNGGDLDTFLKRNHAMTEEKALELMFQMSKAFNTINNLDIKNSSGRKVIIMHRDIKTANILFHDGKVKIADFGFAKMIDEATKNVKMQHTLLGTPLYMAPQILNDEAYTAKCDIWSSGLVFYECLFGKLPWTGTSIVNLYKNIRSQPLKLIKQVAPETKDLLEKMLQIDETKRISWKEIEDHPAMKAVEYRLNAALQTKQYMQQQSPLKSDQVNITSPMGTQQQNYHHPGYQQQQMNFSPYGQQQGGHIQQQQQQPYGTDNNNDTNRTRCNNY